MSDNIFVKHEAVAGSAQEIRDLADQGIFLHYDSIKKVFND